MVTSFATSRVAGKRVSVLMAGSLESGSSHGLGVGVQRPFWADTISMAKKAFAPRRVLGNLFPHVVGAPAQRIMSIGLGTKRSIDQDVCHGPECEGDESGEGQQSPESKTHWEARQRRE